MSITEVPSQDRRGRDPHVAVTANRGVEAPGPRGVPRVGSLRGFLRDKLGFLSSCAAQYGDVVKLEIGVRTYLVSSPEDIRHVLVANSDNYAKTPRVVGARARRFFGDGVVTASGAQHLRTRRMLQPLFHESVVSRFAAEMIRATDDMLARWRDAVEVDVHAEMLALTQRIIVRLLLGEESEDDLTRFTRAISVRRRYQEYLLGSVFPFPEYVPNALSRAHRRASRDIDAIIEAGVARRRGRADAQPGDLLSMLVLDARLLGALKGLGWRVVHTVHDPLPGLARRVSHRLNERLLALADALIVHTPQQASAIAEVYPAARPRLDVIPHGGAVFPAPSAREQAAARASLGIEPDRPVLLLFGMLKPYKGIRYLVDAMPGVLARFPRALLVIAGESLMPLGAIEEQIRRLRLEHAISLRPAFIPQHGVPCYLRAADMVIAPYVEIGASGVVVLAQGHGRAVVVTDVGGLPDFVERGQSGFIVPPASSEALAEAICRGLGDPEALAEMGRRAAQRIARENAWDDVARRTLELYGADRSVAGPCRSEI